MEWRLWTLPIMHEGTVISKTATLDGINVENINVGRQDISVSGFPTATTGKLIVDIVIELKCTLGTEKCSGNNLQVCELVNRDFPPWFEDPGWSADVHRYIDKGEVVGKCELECVEDSHCGIDDFIGEKFCSNNEITQKYESFNCINFQCEKIEENRIIQKCTTNELCENAICKEIPQCFPKTCTELDKECGLQDDGCGNNLDCGECSGLSVCNQGTCEIVQCIQISDCKSFAEVTCDDGSLWYKDYNCVDSNCAIGSETPPESCIAKPVEPPIEIPRIWIIIPIAIIGIFFIIIIILIIRKIKNK
jgi:hypothetical protein